MTTTVTTTGLFLSVGALVAGQTIQELTISDQANQLFLRELSKVAFKMHLFFFDLWLLFQGNLHEHSAHHLGSPAHLNRLLGVGVAHVDTLFEFIFSGKLADLSKSLSVQLFEGVKLLAVDLGVLGEVELRLLLGEPAVVYLEPLFFFEAVFHFGAVTEYLEVVLAVGAHVLLLLGGELVDVPVEDEFLLIDLTARIFQVIEVNFLVVGDR